MIITITTTNTTTITTIMTTNVFKVVPEVASRLANSALMQLRSLPPILRLHRATFLAENQVFLFSSNWSHIVSKTR